MSFFNEKWNNSSILTKAALCAMLLNSLLLLIGSLILLSWEKTLGVTMGYYVFLFILFLYNALLSFGIFKVNGVARVFTILEGLGSVLAIVMFIAGYKYVMAYANEATGGAAAVSAGLAAGLLKNILPMVVSLIPPKVLAAIGFYLAVFMGPNILQLLSMLILFFCGKDFKKIKKEEALSAASVQ